MKQPPLSQLPRRVLLIFLAYFLISGAVFASLGISRMFSEWDWLNDLHFFTRSAEIALSEQREILYDPQARVDAGLGTGLGSEVFPFPATVAVLYWPLTLFEPDSARVLFLAFSIACAALSVFLAYRWSGDALFALFVALAYASMFTFYEAMRFSQLSPVLSLGLCVTLLSMSQSRTTISATAASLVVLKASAGLAPLVLLFWQGKPRPIALAVLLVVLAYLVIPFLLVGPNAMRDYVRQLADFREEAFELYGFITAGASWMFNWNGFIARALDDNPPAPVIYALDALTALLVFRVWLRRDLFDSFLAGTLATLLVMPHAVWYDWLILLGVGPFVLYVRRSLPLAILLIALHFSISLDSYTLLTAELNDRYFIFATTIIAAATLFYLALTPNRPAVTPDMTTARVA